MLESKEISYTFTIYNRRLTNSRKGRKEGRKENNQKMFHHQKHRMNKGKQEEEY
jgi:hypothetical protein